MDPHTKSPDEPVATAPSTVKSVGVTTRSGRVAKVRVINVDYGVSSPETPSADDDQDEAAFADSGERSDSESTGSDVMENKDKKPKPTKKRPTKAKSKQVALPSKKPLSQATVKKQAIKTSWQAPSITSPQY